MIKVPLKQKLTVSARGVWAVIKKPSYLLFSLLVSAGALGVILWSLNFNLLGYIIFQAPLDLFQKAHFLLQIYGSIITNYQNTQALTMVVFSVLFGLNLSMLVYVVRNGRKQALKSGKSTGGLVFAVIGSACAACGVSIVGPLAALVGATATTALVSHVSTIANTLAIILITYSLFSLGVSAASLSARNKNSDT